MTHPDENPRTSNELAAIFMRTLQETERTGDVTRLVALFADDADCGALVGRRHHRGRDGVRAFWAEYLGGFREIASAFSHVADGGADTGVAVLEWTSRGTTAAGSPIEYDGCSVLETDAGRVKRFRTYYDSAAFVKHPDADPPHADPPAANARDAAGRAS